MRSLFLFFQVAVGVGSVGVKFGRGRLLVAELYLDLGVDCVYRRKRNGRR